MQRDYLLREIENLSRAIAGAFMKKDLPIVRILDDGVLNEDEFLRYSLRNLLAQGELNRAENLLFDELERNPSKATLETGLWFYGELNQFSDYRLQECRFSREEIAEGLEDLREIINRGALDEGKLD